MEEADGEVEVAEVGAVRKGGKPLEEVVVGSLAKLDRSAGLGGAAGGGVLTPGADAARQLQQQQQQQEAEGALAGASAGSGSSGARAGPAAFVRRASSSTPAWGAWGGGSLYGTLPNSSCYHSPLQHITVSYKVGQPYQSGTA